MRSTTTTALDGSCIARPSRESGPFPPSARTLKPFLRGEAQFALAQTANFRIACAMSDASRSEEHTSELQSLMRISYAVFCLKKKKTLKPKPTIHTTLRNITDIQQQKQ